MPLLPGWLQDDLHPSASPEALTLAACTWPGDPCPTFSQQVDVHIFEPQGISFLETESSFMTKELEEALITSQNETKVGQPWPAEMAPLLHIQGAGQWADSLSRRPRGQPCSAWAKGGP